MAIIGDSPMGLQNTLNLLKTYCNTWALEVNIQKHKLWYLGEEDLAM